MTDVHELAGRWPLPGRQALRDRLLAAYGDPARGYHDLTHLAEVLDRVEELAEEASDLEAVRLAAWFHDAVYDDGGDLEERSARLAEEELAAAGVPAVTVAAVARLVRMTAEHDPGEDPDARVLSDADLAILAADEERYAGYVDGVRRDYAHVPEGAFRAGRAAVLRDLAARPVLFRTRTGRDRWEPRARANLARELASLGG